MKNNTNTSTQSKVSAKEMMDLVIGIDQKVTALAQSDTSAGESKKGYSQVGNLIAVLVIIMSVAIITFMFVPKLAELVPALAEQQQWICLGYVIVTTLSLSVPNIKPSMRIVAVLFAIAPIAANLIVSAL